MLKTVELIQFLVKKVWEVKKDAEDRTDKE